MSDVTLKDGVNPNVSMTDFYQERRAFHESGLHKVKSNKIHEHIEQMVPVYQNLTADNVTYDFEQDYIRRIYQNELAEFDKVSKEANDFNFGANVMASIQAVDPKYSPELEGKIKEFGLHQSIVKDPASLSKLVKLNYYNEFKKVLKGRPLPTEFFKSERFAKQAPETQWSLVELNSALHVLNGDWKKPIDTYDVTKGYESQSAKYELRQKVANGEIDDYQAITELNRINYEYGVEGFWSGVFSGFGSFGAEVVKGIDIVSDKQVSQEKYLNDIQNKADELLNAEPSLANAMMSGLVSQNITQQRAAAYNILSLSYGQAESEARVHQLEQVVNMKNKKPALDLNYLLDETESAKNRRALMFSTLNVLSFVPLPVSAVTKTLGVAGQKLSNVAGKGLQSLQHVPMKSKVLGDVIPNAIAKVSARYADNKIISNALAKRAAAKAGATNALTKTDLATSALLSFGVSAAAESALQATIEGLSAADYTDLSNEITQSNDSEFQAFFKAASNSFVDNLLVSFVMGAPNAIVNLGTIAKEVAHHSSKFETIKAQQEKIDNAVKNGAAPEQLKVMPLAVDAINLRVDNIADEINGNKEILKELSEVANDTLHPAKQLAERIIVSLSNNDAVGKKLNRASSAEAFIVNPVELALLYNNRPNLEASVKRNQTTSNLTEAELIERYEQHIAKQMDVITQSNEMFEADIQNNMANIGRKINPSVDAIEADINSQLSLLADSTKDFSNNELRNVARYFSPLITNMILSFAREANINPIQVYKDLNLKFVAGKRVYDIKTGKEVIEGGYIRDNNETKIYLSDSSVAETLTHELAHMYLDMLKLSKAELHQNKLQRIINNYTDYHGHDRLTVDKISPEMWDDIQEQYAYNSTFQMANDFMQSLDRANRYLDLLELASQVDQKRKINEELIAKGETPKYDEAELDFAKMPNLNPPEQLFLAGLNPDDIPEIIKKKAGPRFNRLTEAGILRPDADLTSMLGMSLYRHFGDCTTYSEFINKFSKHYKDTYGKEFQNLATKNKDKQTSLFGSSDIYYDALSDYRFLNDISKGSYSCKEFTDQLLDPASPDYESLSQIVGKNFVDEFTNSWNNLKDNLNSKALEVFRKLRHENVELYNIKDEKELLNAKAFDVNYLLANKTLTQAKMKLIETQNVMAQQQKFKSDLQNINDIIKQYKELSIDEFKLNHLSDAQLKTLERSLTDIQSIFKVKSVNTLDRVSKLINKYVKHLENVHKDNLINLNTINQTIEGAKKDIANAEKRLVKRIERYNKYGFEFANSISTDTEHILARLNNTSKVKLDSTADYILNKTLSTKEHIDNLKDANIVFSADDLINSGFNPEQLTGFRQAGLISDKPTMSFAEYENVSNYNGTNDGVNSLSPRERLIDMLAYSTDAKLFVSENLKAVRDGEFNKNLIDILEVRKDYDNASLAQMLKVTGQINKELIVKYKSQVNRATQVSEMKAEASKIVLNLNTKVTPYQLVRKAEANFRRGTIKLAKSNKNNMANIDEALRHFTVCETLMIAAKELLEVKTKIDKTKTRLKRNLSKISSNDYVKKNYEQYTFHAAKALGYKLGLVQSKRAYNDIQTYQNVEKELGFEAGDVDLIDNLMGKDNKLKDILHSTDTKNIANMSINEALNAFNKIDSLLNLSSNLKSLHNVKLETQLNQSVDLFTAKLEELKNDLNVKDNDNKKAGDLDDKRGTLNAIKRFIDTTNINTMRPSTIIAMIDGEVEMSKSKLYNAIYNPILEAEQSLLIKQSELTKKYVNPMRAKLKELNKNVKLDKPYIIEGLKVGQDGKTKKVTYTFGANGDIVNEVAVLVANLGTVSNREAMCRSLGITNDQLVKHVEQLTKLNVITDDLFDCVRDYIWKPYDDIYNKTVTTYSKVKGVFFPKESGVYIQLPSGRVIQGGYSPLTVARDLANSEIKDPLEGDLYVQATLPNKDGFTKDRVVHDLDMSFDMKDIYYNMKRQVTYAYMAPPCVDAHHILNTPQVKAKLEQVIPNSTRVLSNGLVAAMSQSSIEFNAGMTTLISRFAAKSNASMLAYNTINALMGMSQILTSMIEIKNPKYLIQGMYDFLFQRATKGPLSRRKIDSVSKLMRNRNAFAMTPMDKAINKFDTKTKAGEVLGFLEEHAFFFQSVIQNMCDYVVWSAAYHRHLDLNVSKMKVHSGEFDMAAVKEADAVVRRTQLSKNKSDLSEFESRENVMATILTPFSSVFVSMINLSRIYSAAIDRGFPKHAKFKKAVSKTSAFMAVWILPTIATEAIRSAAQGDDVEQEPLIAATMSALGYSIHPMFGAIVGLLSKHIVNLAFDAKEYIPAGVYSSPLETLIEKSVKNTMKMFGDNSEDVRLTDVFAVLGMFIAGYTQFAKNINYVTDYLEDNLFETNTTDLVRGFITGKASKEQKGE